MKNKKEVRRENTSKIAREETVVKTRAVRKRHETLGKASSHGRQVRLHCDFAIETIHEKDLLLHEGMKIRKRSVVKM